MSGKRQATSELNHDNWDREEEPEQRGSFRTANEDELKNRVIKKAKRKIAPGNPTLDGAPGTQSVFSGFSGFGKTATTPTSSSPFSFLNKIPAVAAATSGVVSSSTATTSATPTFSFGSTSMTVTTTAESTENSKPSFSFGSSVRTLAPPSVETSSPTNNDTDGFTEYYNKLSCLNRAVCEWIKTHVDKNPVCILSPIFNDYRKYLDEIENEKKKTDTKESTAAEIGGKPSSSGVGGFMIPTSSSNKSDFTNSIGTRSPTSTEKTTKTNGFNFAPKQDSSSVKPFTTTSFSFNPTTCSTTVTSSSNFSFGNANKTNQPTAHMKPFSFNPAGTEFSFGNIKPPDVCGTSTSENSAKEEEDDEPPKNEFKQVVEDDAIYSKKCKVFVKKDGNFVDKGVGTLYLKPVASSDKTQLLVRADTNLGNILVNLILSSAIPTQRMGKNNVMMVCLPTPDVTKPTSMLLRVKTGEEADELLENIDKYKK